MAGEDGHAWPDTATSNCRTPEGTLPRGAIPLCDLELSEEQAAANLRYLEDTWSFKGGAIIGVDGLAFSESTITAASLDFLEDDGGLSAILGIITVKLHADTIKGLDQLPDAIHWLRSLAGV